MLVLVLVLFAPEAFEQVDRMLPEFSSFVSTVGRLLQDFRTATVGLQAEQAFIQTQRTILEELLWESWGRETMS